MVIESFRFLRRCPMQMFLVLSLPLFCLPRIYNPVAQWMFSNFGACPSCPVLLCIRVDKNRRGELSAVVRIRSPANSSEVSEKTRTGNDDKSKRLTIGVARTAAALHRAVSYEIGRCTASLCLASCRPANKLADNPCSPPFCP